MTDNHDPALAPGQIAWFSSEEDGRVFRRGKHKGRPLEEVARLEKDYLSWMLSAEDMDEDVLRIVRNAIEATSPQTPLEPTDHPIPHPNEP